MFDRFTDRARRVVVLAQEEARLLNHNYIGTEHVLLGLIHEGEGAGARALRSLSISLEAVRREVEKIIGEGSHEPSGHIPFTPRAKKVLEYSLREALQLGHNYIGTEHILLGLVREGEGVAAQILVLLGADLDRVRMEVIAVLSGQGVPDPPADGPRDLSAERTTGSGMRAISLAGDEARLLGHGSIGAEHFVLGLIREGEGVAASAFEASSISLEDARRAVEDLVGRGDATTTAGQAPRHIPFTEEATRILQTAKEAANRAGLRLIGTEHLLLGLVREEDSIAGGVVGSLGTELSEVYAKAIELVADREAEVTRRKVRVQLLSERFTDEVHRAISLAHDEARLFSAGSIGTEHLLLGLLRVPEGLAAELLAESGVELSDLRRKIFQRQSDEDTA